MADGNVGGLAGFLELARLVPLQHTVVEFCASYGAVDIREVLEDASLRQELAEYLQLKPLELRRFDAAAEQACPEESLPSTQDSAGSQRSNIADQHYFEDASRRCSADGREARKSVKQHYCEDRPSCGGSQQVRAAANNHYFEDVPPHGIVPQRGSADDQEVRAAAKHHYFEEVASPGVIDKRGGADRQSLTGQGGQHYFEEQSGAGRKPKDAGGLPSNPARQHGGDSSRGSRPTRASHARGQQPSFGHPAVNSCEDARRGHGTASGSASNRQQAAPVESTRKFFEEEGCRKPSVLDELAARRRQEEDARAAKREAARQKRRQQDLEADHQATQEEANRACHKPPAGGRRSGREEQSPGEYEQLELRGRSSATYAERRVDPEDGKAYTHKELWARHRGVFSNSEIEAYWWGECRPA
mmetsp:Transcript_16273/g.38199  ORF Transcript_16273/g.38199 Transcript_16273/m.38199 type:complete len:416 (-) Transcript_16273:174-1421(-)